MLLAVLPVPLINITCGISPISKVPAVESEPVAVDGDEESIVVVVLAVCIACVIVGAVGGLNLLSQSADGFAFSAT